MPEDRKAGLMLAIGSPAADEGADDVEGLSAEAYKAAARELLAAVKAGNVDGVAEALRAACEAHAGEREEEDGEY